MPAITPPPVVDGVSEHRGGSPPMASLLAMLSGGGDEGPSRGAQGSATRGRRVIRDLEDWAAADPRVAPKLSRIIEQLIGLASDEASPDDSDHDQPYKVGGGDIFKTPV